MKQIYCKSCRTLSGSLVYDKRKYCDCGKCWGQSADKRGLNVEIGGNTAIAIVVSIHDPSFLHAVETRNDDVFGARFGVEMEGEDLGPMPFGPRVTAFALPEMTATVTRVTEGHGAD